MEYTIQKLAHLAGISTRTLRYYDQIGLLSPARTNAAGYRIYGTKEVDVLQQIDLLIENVKKTIGKEEGKNKRTK